MPAGATLAILSWTGLPAITLGTTPVVRLRLTTATLTDAVGTVALDERSVGAAPNGEVEDHFASVVAGTDYGDAPDTYGTLSGSNGPVHTTTGPGSALCETTRSTRPERRRDRRRPQVSTTRTASRSTPTSVTRTHHPYGIDPITLDAVVNTLGVDASAAGFVSAWVDINQDGTSPMWASGSRTRSP